MGAVADTTMRLMREQARDRDAILDALIDAGGKMSTLHLLEDLYGVAVAAILAARPDKKERK